MKKIFFLLFLSAYINAMHVPLFIQEALLAAEIAKYETLLEYEKIRAHEACFAQLQKIAHNDQYYFSLLPPELFTLTGEQYLGRSLQ